MRRLSLQILALLIALAAIRLVAGADAFSAYLLRDGFVLCAAAALLFAINAATWRATAPSRWVKRLPRAGQTLLLTGAIVACAAGAAAGLGWNGVLGLATWLAWGLGLALMVAGAWWPGAEVEYNLPAYRWATDASGHFVRVPVEPGRLPAAAELSRRSVAIWLLALLVVAAILRLWDLSGLPPGCVGNECVSGLRLMDGQPFAGFGPGQFHLYEHLARLLFAFTGAGVLSLRLAAGMVGVATVAAFFGVACRLTAPANALLATMLLALSPWHIWASRSSDPWVLTALLAVLALWWVLEAVARGDARGWVMAGLALGLFFVETPSLRTAILLWALLVVVWVLFRARRHSQRASGQTAAVAGIAAALAVALPALVSGGRGGADLLGLVAYAEHAHHPSDPPVRLAAAV